MADGLKANAVRHVVQDSRGFIWFGTDNGLCRYDGLLIQPYHIPQLGMSQYITALAANGDDLLVGSEQGLTIFHLPSETFEPLSQKAQDGQRLASIVTGIICDRDSNLWISSRRQGVFCYLIHEKQLRHYKIPSRYGSVEQVYVDNDNQVWAVCNGGSTALLQLDKLRNIFVPTAHPVQDGAMCMLQTRDGRLWLGSWNQGLLALSHDTATPLFRQQLNHIHALCEVSTDRLLVGADEGLFVYHPQSGQLHSILQDFPFLSSLGNTRFVYSILKDREGGIWYGTFYGGANYISPVGNRFDAFVQEADGNGLKGSVISRFCEDGSHRVWIASDDGGLNCLNPSTNQFADYPHSAELSRRNVHALCMEGDNLWIGTYTDGIYLLNTKTGQLRHRPLLPSGGNKNSAYSIWCDASGLKWIGTMSGVVALDGFEGAAVVSKDFNAMTIDIRPDGQGHLWMATQGNGLWRYTVKTGRWKQYKATGQPQSLPDNQVNGLCVDASGRLLVGTFGGLCVYRPSTDDFQTIRLDIETPNVNSIIEDQGQLWLATDEGIVRYSPDQNIWLFNRNDGIVSEQSIPNAGFKSSDGRVYFGTVSGFNSFYPYQIKVNKIAPPVVITRLDVFNRPVLVGDDRLKSSLPYVGHIDLYHGDDMFSISFASLSYCSPAKNQYAYRLDGFDKDWNYVGSQSKAVFTNIPSGTYTFRVRATNNDGVWGKEATLRIVVHPPFWWTWWARLSYLFLALAGIYAYAQLRVRKVKKGHRREMEDLNEKKNAEVREQRLQFFTMIAHEIRTPVSLIIGPLEKIMSDNDRGQAQGRGVLVDGDSLSMIDRNAHRLLDLINQLLDFNKVQQHGLKMHFRLSNIPRLVRHVTDRFVPTLRNKGVDFQVILPDDFSAVVDSESVTKVVSNLMTNATKYTRSKVTLRCQAQERTFSIEVEDDGIGISRQDQKRIFNPFFQASGNKPGTGIGLAIVKNIVDMHHGEVIVRSEPGHGSVFTVILPMQQDVRVEQSPSEDSHASGRQAPPAPRPAPPSMEAGRLPVLLIVEDDDDMLHFLVDNFKPHYQVITAGDGMQGLWQLARFQVSLIVSDWMMPEMDGAEFCRRVRQDASTSHIPFVLLTAKTDDASKVEAMQCGADAYIEKPFSMKYLDACIHNMLERRRHLFKRFTQTPDEPISGIAVASIDNELLTRMSHIIEENIDNTDFNVNLLADKMGMSRSTLFAKIKSIANVTPNEMIQVIRLRKAAQLLSTRQYRVSEVAYMVGFSNPSYFSKCFQKQFNVKPTEYHQHHE